jgi:hypothetical protein
MHEQYEEGRIMNRLLTVACAVILFAGVLFANELSDTFPATGPELTWTSAYDDTLDNPLTEMGVATFTSPSGDNSVGIVVCDTAYLGGMGVTYGGPVGLTDYSVEANVYVQLDSAYYQGIMSRFVITDSTAEGYQLAANFGMGGMVAKVKFRRWNQSSMKIVNIAEWAAADLPGGAPTEDGWHKLKIEAKGNEFRCYWDDQLLGDGALSDTSDVLLTSGHFGVYVWDMFTDTPQSIMVDDFTVVELLTDWTDSFPSTGPELIWTSAYDDTLNNPLTEMGVTTVTSPSGDNSVGIVVCDTAYLGGMGVTYGGTADLTDYSVEANVYVQLDSAYYQGIMSRFAITDSSAEGYQLAANFGMGGMVAKVKFRRWNQSSMKIVNIAEWPAADLPGGAPTEDGWHKLKIEAKGNEFWCYWDDQLLGDGALTDTSVVPITSGYFGVYVWDMFTDTPQSIMVDDFMVAEVTEPVSIKEVAGNVPVQFTLAQNYPNPFNPTTTIEFQVYAANQASLDIYDINGRLVATLLNGFVVPNRYSMIWDGRDHSGRKVPSGVYFYRLVSGAQHEARRMILLK